MINANISAAEAPDFVWQHLQQDLKDVAESLGRQIDDASIVVHMVLRRISTATIHLNGKVIILFLMIIKAETICEEIFTF